jgi:hypothetical protein
MDEVDDVDNKVVCVDSLYRLVNQDIITINDRLTESTFITVRKTKILGARPHRNIGTEGSNEGFRSEYNTGADCIERSITHTCQQRFKRFLVLDQSKAIVVIHIKSPCIFG